MQTPRPDRFTYPLHGESSAYPAGKARQGRIVLRKPWMRAVFAGGLAGIVVIGFALSLAG
ncbi:hypothetical protein [Dongia sedimenti]|uniref:Peptide ABC transporter permease n=1 Tax=Dongia sedimenti TaxID=3064282 RepID=A0ABU0YJP1_9PROT|nr:hypothetical protein [Rhodospirillaceae bacterium R-7]